MIVMEIEGCAFHIFLHTKNILQTNKKGVNGVICGSGDFMWYICVNEQTQNSKDK